MTSQRDRVRSWVVVGVTVCGAFAWSACSSDAAPAPATGGSTAAGGSTSSGGATATTGGSSSGGQTTTAAGGSTGGSTTTTGGSSGGSTTAGGSGATTGGSGATAGSGGSTAGSGGATVGGSGGGSTASGGSGGGSTGDCAGHVLSLSANGTGTASDAAMARVEADLAGDLPIGNSKRTVELWAYMKNSDWTGNKNTLFFYGGTTRTAPGFGFDFGDTKNGNGTIDPFTNGVFDAQDTDSGVTAATSQWVHFAMTWNGTAVLAYVNGILKSTVTSTTTQKTLMTTSSVLTIGGYPYETAYFADYIDEFRVWNVERSATDIMGTMKKTLTGTEAGLVGYWKFNEASGTTAADSVTSAGHAAHNGTLKAAASNQTPTFVVPATPTPVTCP